MTVISDLTPGAKGDIMRRLVELERTVRELAAGRRLEAATIKGGHLAVVDDTGAVKVLIGKIDQDALIRYGIALVNAAGQLTTLEDFVFGPQAATDPVQGTKSTGAAYGDLTGADPGPQVDVTIGQTGRALAFWSCEIAMGGPVTNLGGYASVELSGANASPASGSYALGFTETSSDGKRLAGAQMHFFKNLTPGLTTFAMKYRVDGTGSLFFRERELAVFPY